MKLLFEHFELLADAPNSVPKLRELILQLAVQGKLVPQNSSDEPASELLKRIQAEKERLIVEGKIKKEKPLPPISAEEIPYELPEGWEWVRFGQIAQHNSGKTLDRGRNSGQPRDYITTSNLYWGRFELYKIKQMAISDDELERCTAKKNDLLICEGGEAGRAAVWNFDYEICFQNHIHRARFYEKVNPYFAYRFLEKLNFTGEINIYRKGVGISSLSGKTLSSIAFPLPPLSEQKRIVAKVEQLMALCDELEQKQAQRSQKRIHLNNAALNKLLTASKPEEFREHWQRIASNFELLYDAPETVTQLKQAILQLAVQGKLIKQDPNDEPAGELLKRIRAEKERLIAEGLPDSKAGKIKKEKPLPAISEEEIPYPLPEGWVWCRFGELHKIMEYGTSQKATTTEIGIPVLRMGNINGGTITYGNLKYVDSSIKDLPRLYLKKYDLLFNRTNSFELVGKTGIFLGNENEYTFASYLIRVSLFLNLVCPEYVNFYLNSPIFRVTQIEPLIIQQCGQANVSGSKLKNTLFPLPPYREQKRIVAKVEELLNLCNALKEQLTRARQKSERLMSAVAQGVVGN